VRALVAVLVVGCAHTDYRPQVVARGELVLQQHGQLEMVAAHRRVARALDWRGLEPFVRCVPAAQAHAQKAARDGRASRVLAWVGGALAVASLGSLGGLADADVNHKIAWLGAGGAVAIVGTTLAGVSRLERNRANGHAVDALNYYNDAVGSRGTVCE
jgi:hypothetical protein